MDVIKIGCWSIIAAELAFLISVSHVNDVTGYVQQKPQNAIVKVGDNVTFFCTSNTDKVTWWFACTRCNRTQRARQQLYDGNDIVLHKFTPFATVTKRSDTNGLQSSLTISSVDSSHEGKYTCMDGDGDTAAGHLTETESSPASCLTVSPRDVVVTVGETVLLEAASSTSKPRWYRQSRDKQIFNSKSMNHGIVDERYDVITGNGDSYRADLVIRDVRVSDAGQYIASNTIEQSQVVVNVVVLERPIECHVSDVAFRSVTLQCGFTYSGPLAPTITLNGVDVTNSSLNSSARGGTVGSSFDVSFFDVLNDNVPRWTATFSLSRCGEVIDQYEWAMNIENVGPMSHFIGNMHQLHLIVIVVLVVASTAFLVGIIMCCCSCWLISRRRKKDDVDKSPEVNNAYESLITLPLSTTAYVST